MDCSRTTTERNSASHRNILKISSFLMNSAGAKMSCSGSRKSLASWAWSPKNQIQCTKASGAAAPGSNSRSPKPKIRYRRLYVARGKPEPLRILVGRLQQAGVRRQSWHRFFRQGLSEPLQQAPEAETA